MNAAAGDRFFVGTDLLLYALDPLDSARYESANRWMDLLWSGNAGRISWQVLNEFCANGERKLKLPRLSVRRTVRAYSEWQPSAFSMGLLERAWYWMDEAGTTYWDALIVASAEMLGCRWLLSEDFQEGRKYGTVHIVNPFRTDPDALVAR
jgi:predicted nucleic acid-binding protein